jgi:excisionase family DNA binding protein
MRVNRPFWQCGVSGCAITGRIQKSSNFCSLYSGMTLPQYRRWLTERLKEAEPLDSPSELESPCAVAVEATKRLGLLGLGRGDLHDRAQLVDSPQSCASILIDCLAALPQDPNAPSPAMSVVEAAGVLGVSKETVYRLCSDQQLAHSRIGARITITPQQLADYQSR